ncbi:hypothetical protein QOZ80_7BG0590080 [Eleusine coracana subsp. coracana]|nr:hypothetical protein QOZ80_7BG0590040 [Eleusine coracana subsp. coracana]KAK3124655.1 hypothetical protein QOZ80_7BG0590080 [Eleusine coracana subsp. coracana]
MIHGEDLVRAKVVTIGEALQEVAQPNKAVTVGDVLQAVTRSKAGDKPVDFADAAAIRAVAEMCTTGSGGGDEPGGLAEKAIQAAEMNVKPADERSGGVATVRLKDVLGDAKLPGDKVVTREDAEKVATAARSNAGKRGAGTGKAVVEAMTTAADMNERNKMV